jgi:hypothetical protein
LFDIGDALGGAGGELLIDAVSVLEGATSG